MEHKIVKVMPGSIGEELEVSSGDILLKVNDQEIEDIFDYQSLTEEELVVLLIRKPDGEEWELEIEKDPYEDLGLVFESDLMSDYRSCRNNCIFCFVDQMPPGLRPTLYFKDDDSRLSFLQGNYITCTNMSDKDIQRIIRYRMEPMNISVHTTDPDLRVKMLKNRFAGKILDQMQLFYDARLHMNAQIVLCKDINDKEALERTLTDLYRFLPYLESVSVVPVGLTRYRENLYPLMPIEKDDAENTIEIVEAFQKKAYEEFGLHFVHASDELYLLAGRDFPEEERYDGYLQLENGVGMGRLLLTESEEAVFEMKEEGLPSPDKSITIATGLLAENILKKALKLVTEAFPERNGKVDIVGIRNDFFGPSVTVAGLVTGQDLIRQLKDRQLNNVVAIPNVMLRSGEEVFLDDVSLSDVKEALGREVLAVPTDGETLVRLMCGQVSGLTDMDHGAYELPDE